MPGCSGLEGGLQIDVPKVISIAQKLALQEVDGGLLHRLFVDCVGRKMYLECWKTGCVA